MRNTFHASRAAAAGLLLSMGMAVPIAMYVSGVSGVSRVRPVALPGAEAAGLAAYEFQRAAGKANDEGPGDEGGDEGGKHIDAGAGDLSGGLTPAMPPVDSQLSEWPKSLYNVRAEEGASLPPDVSPSVQTAGGVMRVYSTVGIVGEPMMLEGGSGYRVTTGGDVIRGVVETLGDGVSCIARDAELQVTVSGDGQSVESAQGILEQMRSTRAEFRRRVTRQLQAAEVMAASQRALAQLQERETAAGRLVRQAQEQQRRGKQVPDVMVQWLADQQQDAASMVAEGEKRLGAARRAATDESGLTALPAVFVVPALAGIPNWPVRVQEGDSAADRARVVHLELQYRRVVDEDAREDRRSKQEIHALQCRVDELCSDLERAKRELAGVSRDFERERRDQERSRRELSEAERGKRDAERQVQELRRELDRVRVRSFSGRDEQIGPKPK